MDLPTLDRRQLLLATGAAAGVGAFVPAALADAALADSALAPAAALARPARPGRKGVRHRGVVYGVVDTSFPQTSWSPGRMRADVAMIARDLGAESILIEGDGPPRLLATAREAADRGLTVWLRPTLGDVPATRILEHLAEVGRGAERLRRDGARVFLSVGCEFVLYVPGIVPGSNALERVQNLLAGRFDPVAMQRRLTDFIARAARTGRSVFGGRLTYSAAHDDVVDWSLFDIVGIDYYSWFARPSDHVRALAGFRRFGKPLAILEFGACTYRDAPRTGADGMGWNVVDNDADPPHIIGDLVRSEATQARYLIDLLGVFDSMHLFAAMVFTFGDAEAPHRAARRFDLDMASYGILAPVWDHLDRPGPGWHWRPKQSFSALARAFAR